MGDGLSETAGLIIGDCCLQDRTNAKLTLVIKMGDKGNCSRDTRDLGIEQ